MDPFLVLFFLTHILMTFFFALKEIDICNTVNDAPPYTCDSNLKTMKNYNIILS